MALAWCACEEASLEINGQGTSADAAPLASTYGAAYYERLAVRVAAELDRPD